MVREVFKRGVKTLYANTKSMWFSCEYTQYCSDYEPGVDTQEVEETYTFLGLDIDYDKELTEMAPYEKGTRLILMDYDNLKGSFLVGSTIVITEVTGKVLRYTIQGIKPIQQDVIMLARLKPGG